jgi:hypothetical protein
MAIEVALAGDTEPLEAAGSPVTPVPVHGQVHVGGRVATAEEAADFGTYSTIVLTGTEDKQRILPQDRHRVRAWVIVSGTGPVWIGSEAQCAQVRAGNTAGGGAQLATGLPPVPIGHKESVWLIGDGSHPATVVVIQERMRA